MRYHVLILLLLLSINSFCQFSLNKVDSIVLSKKYKSSNVEELSKEIAFDFKSDSNKIRAFYIYVVTNIKYDIKLSKRKWHPKSKEEMDSITLSEVNKCILNKKGICWDYSALFQKLCFYQGIEVEQIGGTLRDREIMQENKIVNHGWNSLIVNGERKFIDCTFVPPDKYSKAEYDKFYLISPDEFIYRCFPDDPTKQYLKTPLTYLQFKSLPYVESSFYVHKIKNLSPNLMGNKIKNNEIYSISFQIAEIDNLTSIEVYVNEELIKVIEEIKSYINLNLKMKLVLGDKIKIMSIKTLSMDKDGKTESMSPLITYVAIK
jgi:transglutaminase/protease-like cytokinesis protein 3